LPDILSWHELSSADGRSIPLPAQQIRAFMATHDIHIARLSTNEIVPDRLKFSPGVIISYFAGIEAANIESACRSCWGDGTTEHPISNCENTSLDGLLTHDTKLPRSAWWAYHAYADISGHLLGFTSSEQFKVDGLAGYDPQTKRASLALGSCETKQALNVRLHLTHLDKAVGLVHRGKVRLQIAIIPATEKEALNQPNIIVDKIVPVQDKTLDILLPNVAPQSALIIKLERPGKR
ncbi:MAG: hypothetical protein JOZ57_17090, partial [Abitibacteriaceae bacterium]|nr:hypothetical protein [Abditibacteriaceae bacterium]